MKTLLLAIIRRLGRGWCRLQGAEVANDALVHGWPRILIKTGGRVTIESGCTLNDFIWSNPLNDGRRTVIYAGPGATIRLGANSGVSSSRIVASKEITIGEESLIGAGCLICDSDMHEVPLGGGNTVKSAPIRIGAKVFIGANCTILKGVSIDDGAVIGAHSLVNRDIPAHAMAAGNPARIISRFHA